MWQLIENPTAWDEFRTQIAAGHGWAPDQVVWTSAGTVMGADAVPRAWPVLTVAVINGAYRVLLVAIGIADLAPLLANIPLPTGTPAAPPASPLPQAQMPTAAAIINEKEIYRHISASLLTLINVLIDGRMITKDAYLQKLAAHLAAVDRWTTEPESRSQIEALIETADTLLPKILPDSPTAE